MKNLWYFFLLFCISSCALPPDFRKKPLYDDAQESYWSFEQDLGALPEGALSSGHKAVVYPNVKRHYQPNNRMTKEDFLDQNPEEGSLWASGGQTNYYFTRNFIRSSGESIQIQVEKNLYQDIAMEVKKTLGVLEVEKEIHFVQNGLQVEIQNLLTILDKKRAEVEQIKLTAAAPAREGGLSGRSFEEDNQKPDMNTKQKELEELESQTQIQVKKLTDRYIHARISDVQVEHSLTCKEGDLMLGQILGRDALGNYKVRALKKMPYRYGPDRIVSVFGVIRSTDIGKEGEIILSGKLYEYRVDVSR